MGKLSNNAETFQKSENIKRKNLLGVFDQLKGTTSDMYRNYKDMKSDGTINGDDYFHCKANYDAAQRGRWAGKAASYIGDVKEEIDYFRNRMSKGISAPNAYADYLSDKYVNQQGRQQAKTGLYNSSKEGCDYQRVKGVNDKY